MDEAITTEDASGYLLYHSIGQYPGKAADLTRAMGDFAQIWGRADAGQWGPILGLRAQFLDRWRAIMDGADGSLTTCENVTAGLAALLMGLPAGALVGRRVLVAADCFPSVHFLLAGLEETLGYRLDTVPMRQGAAWVEDEDMLAAWGPDVGLALITWVSSISSHRVDVARLAAHGREMGTLTGVDVTQGAGLLPFSVREWDVDFALSTSLKWMCGTPGAGVLQVAPALTETCKPALRGWFSQPDPFNWDLDRFSYAPDARRFDSGTPSVVSALASLPALDWHAAQDHAALLAHNRALSAPLIEGVEALGLTLVSPRDEERRGGSVMAHLPARLSPEAALAALAASGCHADTRGRLLRLSPGICTTAQGVERALAALHRAL